MCALRFAPDKRTPRAKNSWEEMGGPHGPGRGAERLRSPRPACLASAPARLWCVWYGQLLFSSAHLFRVRTLRCTFVGSACMSFISQRQAKMQHIHTYIRHRGNAYCLEHATFAGGTRLSRGRFVDSTSYRVASASRTTSRDGAPRLRGCGVAACQRFRAHATRRLTPDARSIGTQSGAHPPADFRSPNAEPLSRQKERKLRSYVSM